jgi:3D-(3,5/4)-trihydroxycyclohexane-1,2-dione acylhydrolase (decyclizing)
MATVRLTMAQALVRYLAAQSIEVAGGFKPLFAGVWAIFGHGNVTGLGEALYGVRDVLPTYRGHNEQAMALAATAFAKASNRRQVMACTTSIGPGATNMVTAAAVAHVNRLPLLLLPGDVFANRRPDPVLQQIEDFEDGTVSANDCFRPVSRYFDRITRPEQIIQALPRAVRVLTDPSACGPVTLALCQDVQTEAYDFPESFFAPVRHRIRRPQPDIRELSAAARVLERARKPLIIAGGGVLYSEAGTVLGEFSERHGIPVAETQAGKGALAWDNPLNLGGIGVTGTSAANALATEADVVLAIGTRLQDFTTGSRALFSNPDWRLINLNITPYDAAKHGGIGIVADAWVGIEALDHTIAHYQAPGEWRERAGMEIERWNQTAKKALAADNTLRPSDAQVIGAIARRVGKNDTVVCAAGGLPGELHKLWRATDNRGYHLEYGYSCMGYEIAGGLGVKMALPDREIFVMVGDGSYLMMNSEIATSVSLGHKLIITVLENGGFGSIQRLQTRTGGAPFNNMFEDVLSGDATGIDFVSHAASLGAISERVTGIADLEAALVRARRNDRTTVVVIETNPAASTKAGGAWWDTPIAEVSDQSAVQQARVTYEEQTGRERDRN